MLYYNLWQIMKVSCAMPSALQQLPVNTFKIN